MRTTSKILLPLLAAALIVGGIFLLMPKTAVSEGPPEAVSIVVGNTANAKRIMVSEMGIPEILEPINRNGGLLCVVLAQGRPEPIATPAYIPVPINPTATSIAKRYDSPGGPFSAVHAIDEQRPKTGEVDYLASIREAAIPLHSSAAANCATKTIHVFGSGLNTTGDLDFTQGLLDADFAAVLEGMVANSTVNMEDGDAGQVEALPNLTGIRVVWHNLGRATAHPQAEVPPAYIARMKELWFLVLTAANAESIQFVDHLSQAVANTTEDGYPYVTPLPFAPTALDGWRLDGPIAFGERVLGFKLQSDEYLDGEDKTPGDELARRVLAPFAAAMINSGQPMILVGSAWNDGSGDEIELSRDRAKKARDTLIALGVPPDQLIAVGAGNLGTDVKLGNGELVSFYRADDPEWSRAVWLVPLEDGDDILARFPAI